jgi:hypothetical protein
MAIRNHGPIVQHRLSFAAVYDWKIDRIIDEIKASGIKLPIDYKWFSRTFDGINYQYLQVLKTVAPDDYARILRWFPLAHLELLRYEWSGQS